MNSLRPGPARLGLLLSAPSRWAAPSAVTSASSHLLRPFSQSSQLCDAAETASSTSTPPPTQSFAPRKKVPAPIPLVPDVPTLLTVIGRNMKQHTAKFPTWEALFTLSTKQLRDLGVQPTRDRRYLLRWLQKFRLGEFGIGGDFKYVRDGVAELRMQELVDPHNPYKVRKVVVNVPVPVPAPAPAEGEGEAAEAAAEGEAAETSESETPAKADAYDVNGEPVRVRGYKIVGAKAVSGPFALPLKGEIGSRVVVNEGMWEHKLGRKIDGGERRRAEVRFKRRAAERRAEREKLG